ncbi:A24 family peptidase [Thaumasiovibrio subtropicus]|uniref:A24 family peptidase n=1 Tax=Thaumasiovibrio subtropicus TaxID=1891207 RepID=UPI000B358EBE|nr:prepilin peptidase [Thaumasiovibrio subtropicus]
MFSGETLQQVSAWSILLVLSLLLCVYDIRHRLLPNTWIGVVSISCMVINLQFGIGWNALVGTATVLVTGLFLFYWGIVGAGDVKLLAAYSIAITADILLPTLLLAAIIGGVVTLILVLWAWKSRQWEQLKSRGIPYGIPIALAGFTGVVFSTL